MTNLLNETLEVIERSGHEVSDIYFIGSADGKWGISWDRFKKLADTHYDSGYGSPEVAPDLIVRFTDGKYLRRAEYDGSEWWEYIPPNGTEYDPSLDNIQKLIGDLWQNLEELHAEEENEA